MKPMCRGGRPPGNRPFVLPGDALPSLIIRYLSLRLPRVRYRIFLPEGSQMNEGRRFRFCAVAGFGGSGQEWAAHARHIEQLGFSTLLCPDGTGTFAPFQALSAAAAVTGTLRLGTYVLASPLRTPGEGTAGSG